MSLIKRMRKQLAIYWAFSGSDISNTWSAPVQTLVRWEDKAGTGEEAVGHRHTEIMRYKALAYVDRDMGVSDHLQLGTLQPSTPTDPRTVASWEFETLAKTPNLRNTEILREVMLAPTYLALVAIKARGIQAVTYNRVTVEVVGNSGQLSRTVTPYSVTALRGRPETKLPEVGGRMTSAIRVTEESWEIPKFLLPFEPGSEDWILDASGVRWNVMEWEEGTLRSWWCLHMKKGSV